MEQLCGKMLDILHELRKEISLYEEQLSHHNDNIYSDKATAHEFKDFHIQHVNYVRTRLHLLSTMVATKSDEILQIVNTKK